ncbi:MAG TPA: alanine racemase [Burkholderiales bacterium]|jgi:alanine racemase
MPRPIRALLSASAFSNNLKIASARAGAAKVWAVLKANAYGHGLERAAQALAAADGFAVLDFDEAARLRGRGVRKPILMLEGVFQAADVAALGRHALTPVLHNAEQLRMLAGAGPGGAIDVYLKANTGMNRLGFDAQGLRDAYQALRANPRVRAVTLMTHFADADGAGGVRDQLAAFERMLAPLGPVPRSLANSAALLRFAAETAADWVRPGIMLYGCSPFADQSAAALGLRPVMTLASELISVRRLQRGERVGYGLSYEALGPTTIGIVACGYADGYPRHAPSGTPVLVNGQRARTVGRVSMDMIAIDVSGLAGVGVGTPVTLWGEGLSADEVGAAAGTLSYELFTKVTARVPFIETT